MKIGITAGLIAGTYLIATYFSGEPTPTTSLQAVPALKALPRAQAALVHFEFEPDPNRYEDQQLQVRIERRTDNKLYLVDASKPAQGRTTYYALNGSVNRWMLVNLRSNRFYPIAGFILSNTSRK